MAVKPIEYEPGVIHEFAQRLYRQAGSIILTSSFIGLFFGAIAGAVGAVMAGLPGDMRTISLLSAAVGAILGYVRGRERAFKFKLEAQIALCQVRIERNTGGKNN